MTPPARLLVWQDEPHEFDGQRYWSEWTFGYFVEALAQSLGPVTVAAPTECNAHPRGNPLELPHVRFAPVPGWWSLRAYLRLGTPERRRLHAAIHNLVGTHTAVMVRAPSLAGRLFAREALRRRKPLIVFLGGDIRTAASPLRSTRWLVRLAARALATHMHGGVQQMVRRAALVFAVGQQLYAECRRRNPATFPVITGLVPERCLRWRADSYVGCGPVWLFRAARLTANKGTEHLLDALALLVQRGHDVRLRLVGGCVLPQYLARLQERCRAEGLNERVQWLGHVPFGGLLFDLYHGSTVGVLSSLSEGFPRFINEAWAFSLPVVTARLPGLTPPVLPDENAIVVPCASGPALADGIERVLRDGTLRRRLIAAAFHAAHEYTLERVSAFVAAKIAPLLAGV